MSYSQASKAYATSSVLSATPEQLIVMLYDGAVKFINQAIVALEQDNVAVARKRVARADAIVNELNMSLNMDVDEKFSQSLRSLYLYVREQLATALVDVDPDPLRKCVAILSDLRTAWADAIKLEEASLAR